jgi:hypothetical protein
MRPRFGALTQVLAVVFLVAGIGAGFAALGSGHQTVAGVGGSRLILVALAIGYLVVGVGIWMESLWAWWAGVAATLFVVVMDPLLGSPDHGWIIWSAFLFGFAVSAAQGWRDRSRERHLGEPRI